MSPFDGVNNYYEYKMSGGDKSSRGGNRGGGGGGCLSGCVIIVVGIFAFVAILILGIMYIT